MAGQTQRTPHTPTPWAAYKDDLTRDTWAIDKKHVPGDGRTFQPYQEVGLAFSQANAAYIVKCCNSHDKLVEMLKQAEETLKAVGKRYNHDENWFSLRHQIEVFLKSVEEN